MQARDPAHYLRKLKTSTTPKRMMWLDCAATSSKEQGLYVDRFACAALGSTHYTSKRNRRTDTLTHYDDPLELWGEVDKFCIPQRRTVLFAYDLAYQLRVSQALVHLPAKGWHIDRIVLEKTAAWCSMRDDNRTLLMCDLKSWTPVELGRLASDLAGTDMMGIEAQAGPKYQAELCKTRAGVVRDAVLQILAWIEGEGLGPFRPTGSGQSYGAYRRRFLSHSILVHDDVERLNLERVAMWTGRCEAWKHGALTDGPYVEYDMQAAYCRIAAECDVPIQAMRAFAGTTALQLARAMERYAVLADVEITTSTPIVPTHMGGRTVWPVGTFQTVLWDPELKLALNYADKVKINRAWLYQRAPALQDFAQWVIDNMGPQEQAYGPIPKRVLKHWSRCLVGRLGLRYRTWEKFGYQDETDLRLVTFIDVDEGTSTDMLIAGNDRLILADMQEATDSLPQIPGWVMSECRARLWDAMVDVGLERVVYIDTDSIIFDPPWADGWSAAGANLELENWTTKGQYSRMMIHGPRNLVCESARRVSGLPLTARQTAPLEFTGQVMRSIKESMRAGQLDCVASLPRKFVLDAPDLRRQHLPNHATEPFHVQPTPKMEA